MGTPEPATGGQHALARFFEHCHHRVYAPRATIVSAGEHSNTLFYILSGSVSVIIEDDDGHEIVLAYLNAGDFFGEIGLFDEKHERSAWVRARRRTEVAQLSYERLRALAETRPDVLFEMLSQLSLRIRDTSRKVGDLAFHDVAGRIAHALLDLCRQPGARQRPGGVEVEITRQELGRIVGCSREMASRVMRSLEERGIVSIAGRDVLVRDAPGLDDSSDSAGSPRRALSGGRAPSTPGDGASLALRAHEPGGQPVTSRKPMRM